MMYSSDDPRRAHLPSGQHPVNVAYAQSPENSQVSVTSAPEGSYVFLMQQPFCSQFPSIVPASNNTMEFGNNRVLAADTGLRCAIADASNISATVVPGNAFPMGSVSMMKTSHPSPYNPAGMNPGTSFQSPCSNLTPLLSQSSSPQLPTQPQTMQQHFVVQQQLNNPQTFAQQSGGAVPAATRTVMLFTADPSTASNGSFYFHPASPQMAAAAAMQGSPAQIISPLQLSSPNPQGGNVQGQLAYLVNSSAPPGVMSFSAYPEQFVAFQGPATWAGSTPVTMQHHGPHAPPSSQSCLAVSSSGSAVPMQSVMSYTPPDANTPLSSTAAAVPRHIPGGGGNSSSNNGNASGLPAAGGSPGGAQPAALGVRSFMAPKPVGSCMVRDTPLIPNIPPLALPCPAWGKIPTASMPGHMDIKAAAMPQ
ncbi:hypothetical protein ABL78_6256 [Leptomonas seymouri]|uniref:Uncharacterized protein n=1 Tax=Leptomonas seymouri TaxID=5684 RepID=A0A0N0P4C9_LEPSE|nr:hypothetical protein ABL78_6256 [Leptomonas seymouri]|eukprot:KPI84687.1 hypothetical protein ABL78_6256 [Leptomonas seymouri]